MNIKLLNNNTENWKIMAHSLQHFEKYMYFQSIIVTPTTLKDESRIKALFKHRLNIFITYK